jgi:hypothetical protein
VKLKKNSKSQESKRFLKTTNHSRSGDVTVPYVSLSFAHTWLEDNVNKISNETVRWEEHIPEKTNSRNTGWSPLKIPLPGTTASRPAMDVYYSKLVNGDTTAVVEVLGIDHTEIAKQLDIQKWVFNQLVSKMHKDFIENDNESSIEQLKYNSSVYRLFPRLICYLPSAMVKWILGSYVKQHCRFEKLGIIRFIQNLIQKMTNNIYWDKIFS